MKRYLLFVLIIGGGLLPPVQVQADTVYLKDGSILVGTIQSQDSEVTSLSNPLIGEVSILNQDILYREKNLDNLHVEYFTLVDNGAWVIHQQHQAIPERKLDSNNFSMMIPGTVQTIRDPNGAAVVYLHRVIGGNSLITIAFDDLAPTFDRLTIISMRAGLVFQESSGELTFRLKYIPNEAQETKIIVRYPDTLTQQSNTPEPSFTSTGLVIWEQALKRQQLFQPEIRFTP